MFERGEIKSLVESVEASTNSPFERNRILERDIKESLRKGELTIDDFDFDRIAVELATDGIPLIEYTETYGLDGVTEAMGASAFPIMTKTVVGFTVIQSYETATGEVGKLVTESTSKSTTRDTIPGHTMAGGFENRPEGTRYEEKHIGEKKVTIRTDDFGEMFSFTIEALYEDRLGQLPKWAKDSGEKGGLLRNQTIMQTLEVLPVTKLGETTSTLERHVANGTKITIGDHYNNDHSAVTGLDGQTNDNIDITDSSGAISTNGINAIWKLFDEFVDEKGDKITVDPKAIVAPRRIQFQAWQLFNSKGQFDTGNRAEGGQFWQSVLPGGVITSPFLAQDYYYYVGDFQKQLAWLWTFKPKSEMAASTAMEALTNNIIWRIRFSFHGGCGHTDYKYIVRGGQA